MRKCRKLGAPALRATPVRLGVESVGVTAALEQADDKREVDAEPSGNLALRALVMIDRRRDPLAKQRSFK